MTQALRYNEYWRHERSLQKGQIILATVLLLGIFATVSLYSLIGPRRVDLENEAQTERALALAKEALIAYASGRPTNSTNRPGELPCPDINNSGITGGSCNTPITQIGRLPWRTLGIPDVRDGSGERLWYAVSSNFKYNTPVTPLNSNTPGQLTVTGIAPANNVIAIVFAPGAAVAGQFRTSANVNSVAHYLECENANGDSIFTTSDPNCQFNDSLLAITPPTFFPAVEMKAARELRSTLNSYFSVNHYFPPANAFGATCIVANQGLLPSNPAACAVGHSALVPQPWFLPNQWDQVLFYAVAPACVDPAPSALDCAGTGGFLTVNGASDVRALIITPGTPYPMQARPCASNTDCLEPPNTSSFPTFTHKTGSATLNDRVIIVAP